MNDRPKRRLRFSLSKLVTAVTIVALAVGLIASARQNASLESANRKLASENLRHRNELGIFDVTDPDLIHVIRVPTEDDEPRKYRIYLPPKQEYAFRYLVHEIPATGLPSHQSHAQALAPGHYLISIQLKRAVDPKTNKPLPYGNVVIIFTPTHGSPNNGQVISIGISENQNKWLLNPETEQTAFSWQEIGRDLETYPKDEAIVLYRARANDPVVHSRNTDGKATSWSQKQTEDECDGFMIWIDTLHTSKE